MLKEKLPLVIRHPQEGWVEWMSWPMWRYAQDIRDEDDEHVEYRQKGYPPPKNHFCVTCSGKGKLFTASSEGMIPSADCPTCEGRGK